MEKCHSHSAQNLCEHLFSFFQNMRYLEPDFQISHIPDPNKCVFAPGDAWACPRIHRFISKSENVGQTISDPGQKLIVDTLPSIWQYPFFQNGIKIPVFRQNRGIHQIGFVCIVLPIGIAYWPVLIRCGITRVLGQAGLVHWAWSESTRRYQ